MVIQGILQESRDHYKNQYNRLVGRLIHLPKGSLRSLRRQNRHYWYLRRYNPQGRYDDVYLGPAEDNSTQRLIAFIKERQDRLGELKTVTEALKSLGVRHMELEEKKFPKMLTDLANAFDRAGLWDQGLCLIGSWCFSVYIQAFGVEYYPLKTMDFDFALKVPYTGPQADLHSLLQNLGFSPIVDMAYNKVDYVLPGIGMVEIFMDRDQVSENEIKTIQQNLAVRPALIRHLKLLLDNPVTVKIHGIHKCITIPSMPAFFVHRLITAKFGEYRDPVENIQKIRKDYKQAALVAKKMLGDPSLRQALNRLIQKLTQDQVEKMKAGAQAASSYLSPPDLSRDDVGYIVQAAQLQLKP